MHTQTSYYFLTEAANLSLHFAQNVELNIEATQNSISNVNGDGKICTILRTTTYGIPIDFQRAKWLQQIIHVVQDLGERCGNACSARIFSWNLNHSTFSHHFGLIQVLMKNFRWHQHTLSCSKYLCSGPLADRWIAINCKTVHCTMNGSLSMACSCGHIFMWGSRCTLLQWF